MTKYQAMAFLLIKWLGTYSINWQPWNTQRWLKKPVGKESARTSEEGAHSWWFNQKPKVLILQIDTFTFRRLPSNPHTWNLYINDKQIYINIYNIHKSYKYLWIINHQDINSVKSLPVCEKNPWDPFRFSECRIHLGFISPKRGRHWEPCNVGFCYVYLELESLDDQFGGFFGCVQSLRAETSSKIWEILYKSERWQDDTAELAWNPLGLEADVEREDRGMGWQETWDFEKIIMFSCERWYPLLFATVMFFKYVLNVVHICLSLWMIQETPACQQLMGMWLNHLLVRGWVLGHPRCGSISSMNSNDLLQAQNHQEVTILRLVCTFCWSWYAGESNGELLWNPLGLKGLKKERFPVGFALSSCHVSVTISSFSFYPFSTCFSSHHFLKFLVIKSSSIQDLTGDYKPVDEATRIGRYGRHRLRKRV